MNKPVSANGVKGCLLPMFGGQIWMFRVYNDDGTFRDYDILHSDLTVTITDDDAYFYQNHKDDIYLDHSPATLGLDIGELDDTE